MYQCNRLIYEKEKEKQQMTQEIIEIAANDKTISSMLKVNQTEL